MDRVMVATQHSKFAPRLCLRKGTGRKPLEKWAIGLDVIIEGGHFRVLLVGGFHWKICHGQLEMFELGEGLKLIDDVVDDGRVLLFSRDSTIL